MKKTFSLLVVSLCVAVCNAQDSIRNICTDQNISSNIADEIISQEQTLRTIFLCLLIIAIGVCFVLHYTFNNRLKKYSDIIMKHSQELASQKIQTECFGYILNSMIVPCCLVDSNKKIVWSNDAFLAYFGKEIKEFDIYQGVTDYNAAFLAMTSSKFAVSFFVKTKNVDGKTIGYKRTVVPLPQKDNYAIIENNINN